MRSGNTNRGFYGVWIGLHLFNDDTCSPVHISCPVWSFLLQFVKSLFGTLSSINCCKYCVKHMEMTPGKRMACRDSEIIWACFICWGISPENYTSKIATWACPKQFLPAGVRRPVLNAKTAICNFSNSLMLYEEWQGLTLSKTWLQMIWLTDYIGTH